MNSPSGLACGHNHFLLNPVSGTLFTDIKLFAIMQYGLHYTAWKPRGLDGTRSQKERSGSLPTDLIGLERI